MAKYTVYLETTASMTVTVEVDDGLDAEEAINKAIDKAYEAIPGDVCAQCSGWGQKWSLDLGEWNLTRDSNGAEVLPERQD